MNKPEYLYHGSRYKVNILVPQQAKGSPSEKGDEYGIYAYEDKNMVIPFSLTINPFENGSMAIYVDDETSDITISAGTLDNNAVGYIYKVSSASFEKLDGLQWISKDEVKPIEVTVVNTKDYMHKIKFTGAAKEYRMRTE
jgi:hypothetical protein